MNERWMPVVLGVLGSCTAAVALYALLRVVQFTLFPEPNPALVFWSAHAGYFWRAWTVVYVGGFAGFATFVGALRRPARVARGLVVAVSVAGGLLLVQGLFVP